MVNPGIILLIALAIVLAVAVILTSTYAVISASQHNGIVTPPALPPCSREADIGALIQIPDHDAECVQQGITGPLFYIGRLGDGTFDYVVAPWGTQPLDVCVGFCTGFTGGMCSGPPYAGLSAQENFNHCIQQLSSTTCTPPVPIAAKGTILYYAFSPTPNICD